MTSPIRLHLDTSDYSAMYDARPDTFEARLRAQLKTLVESQQIEIGLSYHVVFELLKKADPQFRQDRVRRARLLTELCGRNAFPYPTDLGDGPYFSTDGVWMPRIDLEEIEIERIIGKLIEGLTRYPGLSRHDLPLDFRTID